MSVLSILSAYLSLVPGVVSRTRFVIILFLWFSVSLLICFFGCPFVCVVVIVSLSLFALFSVFRTPCRVFCFCPGLRAGFGLGFGFCSISMSVSDSAVVSALVSHFLFRPFAFSFPLARCF